METSLIQKGEIVSVIFKRASHDVATPFTSQLVFEVNVCKSG